MPEILIIGNTDAIGTLDSTAIAIFVIVRITSIVDDFVNQSGISSDFLIQAGISSDFLIQASTSTDFLIQAGTSSDFLIQSGTSSDFLIQAGTSSDFLMSKTVQDSGGFRHYDELAESAFDVLQTYRCVPYVPGSPRSDEPSGGYGDRTNMQPSLSSRPVSPRKTYLLGDELGQLQVTSFDSLFDDSKQKYEHFKVTRRVISPVPEISATRCSPGSPEANAYLCDEGCVTGSSPRETDTVGLLDCSHISRADLPNTHTADVKVYTAVPVTRHPGLTLSSHSFSGDSRPNSQPFHLVNLSSDRLRVKNVPTVYSTDDTFTGIRYLATDPGHYASLPHRRASGGTARRATSAEPRNQSPRPDAVKSPIPRELHSEFVALNPQPVRQSYPGLSTLIERMAYGSEHYPKEELASYSNSSAVWNDYAHCSTLPNSVTNSNTGAVSTNHATLHKSMPNANAPSGFKRRAPRKNDSHSIDPKTVGSLLPDRNPTDEMSTFNIPVYRAKENGSTPISNSRTHSNGDMHEIFRVTMPRSQSLTDLQASEVSRVGDKHNYSDDEDGDHFGFLSYPVSFLPSYTSTAMNKAKSPSPGNRIFTKRWRSKTNALPSVSTPVAMWTPGPVGSCTWSSVSGRKVQLRPVSILSLTEGERLALQKVALVRLQGLELGCAVTIPKEMAELPRVKKSPLSLKKRSKSVSASALDTMAKEGTAVGLVFGIPLLRCVLNDRELEARRRQIAAAIPTVSPTALKTASDSSDNLLSFRSTRKSSSSSQGSVENGSIVVSQRLDSLTVPSYRRTASSDNLSESEFSHSTNSNLIDALTLSTSHPPSRPNSLAVDGSLLANQGITQVPYVVKACFKHIETYGLQTLGIFRVGCSKKRVTQLREEFDCGKMVNLTDEYNPHDVGALLKEYFRDLLEPLLTNELYLPFLFAERLKDEHKRHSAISLLIAMLPIANRDTLWALLRFLAVVSQHAADVIDDKGGIVAGNKMVSHNLATLFGPNILRRTRATSDKEFISESVERVEQSKEVIEVVKDMIDNHHELFEISESLRDDVLRLMGMSSQESVDKILRRLASQNQIETDPESMGSVFEESLSSPILYHSANSDADLIAFARKQTAASHRPLRVTKSADNSLDSTLSNSIDTDSSTFHTLSSASRDNNKASSSNPAFQLEQKFNSNNYPSSVPNRIPVLKLPCDQANSEVVLRSRLEAGNFDRPYSEGYNQSLNIPRPLYLRENSNSSIGSAVSSSLNSYGGSDNGQFAQRILPTPPRSRASSPKQIFQTASPSSSSSTLIASPTNSQSIHLRSHSDSYKNNIPIGSTEWEKERWIYWERLATQRKTSEAEQETLV